jgi:SAM-dependent methyltransferase
MVATTAQAEVWDREYRLIRSIPSSTRRLPSKALLLFEQLVDLNETRIVLDAGCGNGRNAVYLATKGCDVVAVDFSPAALATVNAESNLLGMSDRVSIEKVDLLDTLPFGDGKFDLCLDSYVSCHFIEHRETAHYWSELSRVTKAGGYIFISVFSDDDEYYNMIANQQAMTSRIVTDLTNGITKRLYKERELKSSFAPPLHISFFLKFQFRDHVLVHDYMRSLFVVILKKITN